MKILVLIIGLFLNAFAIDNWNDIKPDSYGKNNFSVSFLTGLNSNEYAIHSDYVKDSWNTYGVKLHSKASLKEIHYKAADIFWTGEVTYAKITQQSFLTNETIDNDSLSGNIGIGVASNLSDFIIHSVSIGGGWSYNSFENSSSSSPYAFTEAALAVNFPKLTMGAIYRISMKSYDNFYDSQSKIDALEFKLSIPIQYNVTSKTAFIVTPIIINTVDTGVALKESMVTFGFSWIY